MVRECCGILNAMRVGTQMSGAACWCWKKQDRTQLSRNVIVGVCLSGSSFKDRWKGFLFLHSGHSHWRGHLPKTFKGTGTSFSSLGQHLGQVIDKKPGKEEVGTAMFGNTAFQSFHVCLGIEKSHMQTRV